ncbi:MAG: hypothetical protein Q7T89_11480, partial [Anaerolineales bacterium]|nr:hypothetical protein [Anaerolineales bacterium]
MELDQLIAGIEKLLGYMFGGQPPVWLLPAISWCIGVGLLLAGIAFLLGRAKNIWMEYIQPIRYKPEEIRRRSR